MLQPAASVSTRRGANHYGPTCARLMGLLKGRALARQPRQTWRDPPRREDDPRQVDWLKEATA